MAERKGKIMSLNICSFGVNHIGVPVAAVFAQMCPFVNIAVVDLNSDKVTSWNTKQINMREQGLEDILKVCQNRNLVFTTDMKKAVKVAEIIFLCTNGGPSLRLGDEGYNSDFTETEEAVRFIAQSSDANKIIVINSTVPVGACETIKRILAANKHSNVTFQILSIPTFLSPGNAVQTLLKPDRVLIGSNQTNEGVEAAGILEGMYSQWVPFGKIIAMNNSSAEISKLCSNAFRAQGISTLMTVSIICEESCGDASEIAKANGEFLGYAPNYLEPTFAFGGPRLKNDLKCLISTFERLNLFELADYWREVFLMNEYQKERFIKSIVLNFFSSLNHEKISVWGIAYKKNAEFLEDSPGVELCLNLLADGAKLSIYDTIEKRVVMEELTAAAKKKGLDTELLFKELAYYDDPYKAVKKADAIVVCNVLEEFKKIDFNLIYKEMMKTAYVFDGRKCLPHEELKKIGFIVKSVGVKCVSNKK